jgi:ArsR family transcriptional regulator
VSGASGKLRRVAAAAAAAAARTVEIQDLAEIFKVLADPTRLGILTLLAQGGGRCVHELCLALEMSQPAVSHQLRVLRQAHLVKGKRRGREILYTLDDPHVVALLSEGLRHASHTGQRLSPRKARG